MKTLYIVRHGQTQWNVERRMQGRMDSPLTELGKAQAMQHGKTLRELGGCDRMVASPSGRTQETAYILNSALSARLEFNDVLMERDTGDWGGLTVDEVEKRYPKQWQERERDPYFARPPGGENVQDLVERVQDFLESLYSSTEERVILVTHAIMSRAILTHLLSLSPTESSGVIHPNDLLYRLEFSPTDIEASHFLSGEGPHPGLLRRSDSGTIVRPDAMNPDPDNDNK